MMQYKKGFLLAECMIVVALTAFLTALSFSFMHVLERMTVRVEVDLLLNTIESQRAIAVMDNKDTIITFDSAKNSYTYDAVEHAFDRSITFAYPQGSYGPPSSPTYLIQKPLSFVDNKIVCFATGGMSSGVLYLGSIAQGYFYALSSSVGEWGVLRLYTYHKNKWHKQGT